MCGLRRNRLIAPFAMLDQDNLRGTFTYKDGRKRTLTNGVGGNMVRQWRPYPSFIPDIDHRIGQRRIQEEYNEPAKRHFDIA